MATSSSIIPLILLFHTLLLASIVPGTQQTIKAQVTGSGDEFVMSLSIGTPPVQVSVMIDTGSNLIWTKCTTISYDPNMSASFYNVAKSCSDFGLDSDCIMKYENDVSVNISLGQETLTFEGYNNNIPNVNFACGEPDDENFMYDGIVGMDRGELSLISQSKETVFLYCFGSQFGPQKSGLFLMGSEARSENTNTQTTPLIKQDKDSHYYISLEGISVGETRLPVTKSDFAIDINGKGGMIIDSGTTFTCLEKRVVDMISNEFMYQTNVEKCENNTAYKELEHCFRPYPFTAHDFPNVVFHFEGADWELLRENYIYEVEGENMSCLAFIANKLDDEKLSTFGNVQQKNMMVIYDLEQNTLSFKRADCNQV